MELVAPNDCKRPWTWKYCNEPKYYVCRCIIWTTAMWKLNYNINKWNDRWQTFFHEQGFWCAPVVVLCGFCCGLIHRPVHTYYFVFALLYMLTVIQTKKGFYLLILSRFIYSFIYFPSMKIVSKESVMLYVFSRNVQTRREFVSEVECQQFLSPFKVFCNQSAPVPLWDSHSPAPH